MKEMLVELTEPAVLLVFGGVLLFVAGLVRRHTV